MNKRLRKTLVLLSALAFSSGLHALTLATYNIRNFDYDSRDDITTNKYELRKIIARTKADLIAVQEIVNKSEFKSFVSNYFPDYSVRLTECGGAGKQKLGFMYKKSLLKMEWFREDSRVSNGGNCSKGLRPAAIAQFTQRRSGKKFVAVAVHLKAGGRQSNADVRYRQYSILTEVIRELKRGRHSRLVVLGDFNTTDYILRNQNYSRFIDFVDINGLIDFSADLDCTSYWWGGSDDGIEYASILDHVLVTERFYNDFANSKSEVKTHCKKASCSDASSEFLGVTYQEVSDHCPVVAKLY